MRARPIALFTMFVVAAPLLAQTQKPPEQTARQALIEMFLGNGDDVFEKHLPEAARKAVSHTGDQPYPYPILRMSTFSRQTILRGSERTETFDVGPTILISEQDQGRSKVEITVERDSLAGDTDEIELSAHSYYDGEEQWTPVIPRLILDLKQEKHVWRLIDITLMGRLPLADPMYLRGLRKQQQEANASAAQMRIVNIIGAESGYAARHPERGYVCDLSTLFAPEPSAAPSDQDSEESAVAYFDPGGGSSDWNGYRFVLAGCEGSPASKYQITAVPVDPDPDAKILCADESKTVKTLAGTKISACFGQGEVVSSADDAVPGPTE